MILKKEQIVEREVFVKDLCKDKSLHEIGARNCLEAAYEHQQEKLNQLNKRLATLLVRIIELDPSLIPADCPDNVRSFLLNKKDRI